jgi:hypothetical protein
MADIDDVLERLLTDAHFAHQLASDPSGALAGYSLSQDDVALLSSQVSFDPGAVSLVEERISKAGMFGLLTSFTAGLGSIVGPEQGGLGGPDTSPAGVVAPVDSHGMISNGLVGDGVIGPSDSGETHGIIIHGLVGDGVIGPSDSGETHGIIIDTSVGDPDGIVAPVDSHVVAPVDSHGIIGPVDSHSIIGPVDSPGVIGPTDSEGVIGPTDSEGVIGPTDSGETKGIVVIGGSEQDVAHGTGGGGGGEVSIKEVDPSPAPSVGGLVDPGDTVGFNPQPDPPGVGDKLAAKGIIIND